jgi:hypothetical protein
MSPVYISNPNKTYPSLDSSSMPTISLNNTQIRTFINIYPPTSVPIPPSPPQNFTMGPMDLRKHTSSTVAAQALYHFYFPHLLALQNQQQQQQVHQTINREMKRSNNSDGMFIVTFYFSSLSFYS